MHFLRADTPLNFEASPRALTAYNSNGAMEDFKSLEALMKDAYGRAGVRCTHAPKQNPRDLKRRSQCGWLLSDTGVSIPWP